MQGLPRPMLVRMCATSRFCMNDLLLTCEDISQERFGSIELGSHR
jgi:hypothetical protein